MSAFASGKIVLSGPLATNGTFNINYPAGKDRGAYENAVGHFITAAGGKFEQPAGISISFGATAATITYKGATTLPANTEVFWQLEEIGNDPGGIFGYTGGTRVRIDQLKTLRAFIIELGAPIAAAANSVLLSQAVNSGIEAVRNGANAGVLDVPRNVVAAWTTTAVLTVKGTDQYGKAITEQSASGTSFAGKKAFKTITSIQFSANVTGATVGHGDVLGLPVYLPAAALIQAELADGAAASAGTVVAGLAVNTASTATTADVRGTYDPASACDGAISFQLCVFLPDFTFLGNPQFGA